MEIAIRKTARQMHNGGENPVGEVVCICPDGHPWTPTERSLFHIVKVSDAVPAWVKKRLGVRGLKFRRLPTKTLTTETEVLIELRTYGGALVNKTTEMLRATSG